MELAFALNCFASLMAILNPFGAVPIYLALVPQDNPRTTRRVRWTMATAMCLTLLVFALVGQGILTFFGITLPAFRISGGILLLLMAVAMLHARVSQVKHTPEEAEEAEAEAQSVAIVPLTIPVLSGPGTITTVILLAEQATTWMRWAGLLAAIFLCGVITLVLLRAAARIQKWLGVTGLNIFTRIMGLMLSAIAVQFIFDGISDLLPGLTR